ncbi:GNAT family N-acetyltransferase [Haladaptatus sp. W1]|uniref:arsinothricin resistance N-acetyltransferase ArsN1 family B n=1 Tax=Haladaptatus sp. W1 TaxID=1897478 RepID=UPI0008497321|nr:arsinothricin resistance N-acetyltransferase ArsN1 family B [Haladaptatus sp. W1]ODR79135.1 GNAT family N-acetyltransferase [Haladaptatus sp. W1]
MPNLRFAEAGDAADTAAIYAPVVRETAISFETTPPGEDEMADRIQTTLPTYPWVVCEHDGELLGYAYAGSHRSREAYRWSADVSVYVHRGHRRSGVGNGLYESLFSLLEKQGFYNAYAGIALPNPASVGLHESLGFEHVGTYEAVGYKDDAWQSVGWWHRRLRPLDDPEPPLPLTAVPENALEDALNCGRESIRIT